MVRWTDLVGLSGIMMVVLSTQLLFPGSVNRQHMLGGLALWFVGFASVAGWILLRLWQAGKSHPK